jgi:hypothetical protein
MAVIIVIWDFYLSQIASHILTPEISRKDEDVTRDLA